MATGSESLWPTMGESSAEQIFEAPLEAADPELFELIGGELRRQRTTLDLVASESVPPLGVLEAQGSILTAKYADGYPGHRDYDTCEWVDRIEQLAIDRAIELFGAEHANVQSYSGASANQAVLHALAEPGDVVLGWDFAHGGHPTHCAPETFAGRYYRAVCYGVRREDRLVDMDQVAELARANRPKVIFAGWSCYSRHLDFARFKEIADEVGAALVVDMAHFAGLVAAGAHPDPVPFADVCTMTVHKTLGGARGGAILCTSELARKIDAAVYPGEQGCPLPHAIAAKAVTFKLAGTAQFKERIARTLEGARVMAEALVDAESRTGVPVVTGGTEVHQFLLDLEPRGEEAWTVLGRLNGIGISANAVSLAYDPQPEPACSGLRFGSTALASRGFRRDEFAQVGGLLADALAAGTGGAAGGEQARRELAERVALLCAARPLYTYLG